MKLKENKEGYMEGIGGSKKKVDIMLFPNLKNKRKN